MGKIEVDRGLVEVSALTKDIMLRSSTLAKSRHISPKAAPAEQSLMLSVHNTVSPNAPKDGCEGGGTRLRARSRSVLRGGGKESGGGQ